MERRDLLKAFGAATALAILPGEAVAAWARVASGMRPAAGLTDANLSLIGAVADTILPRTDTPSATDVKVPAFIDVMVSEQYTDAARMSFIAGLASLESALKSSDGVAFVDMHPEHRAVAVGTIERMTDRRLEPSSTYWRLKGLVIHGFFTSETIQKGPMKFDMMPGRFDGAAPHFGS